MTNRFQRQGNRLIFVVLELVRKIQTCYLFIRIEELAEAAVRLTDSVNKLINPDGRWEHLIHGAILQVIIPTEDEFSMWRDTSEKVNTNVAFEEGVICVVYCLARLTFRN